MVTKKHWVCLACGYIYEGDTPPEKCPICKAPKRALYGRHEIPSPPPFKTVKASTVKEEPKGRS